MNDLVAEAQNIVDNYARRNTYAIFDKEYKKESNKKSFNWSDSWMMIAYIAAINGIPQIILNIAR